MPDPIENPPRIVPQVDRDTGHLMITPEEWGQLMMWLQKLKRYIDDELI